MNEITKDKSCNGTENKLLICNCNLTPLLIFQINGLWRKNKLQLIRIFVIYVNDFFFNLFRLSQNIAGVTILAFGNGSPDIFSALAAVNQSRPELVLGALFGAGVFVTTAVAGAVSLSTPFTLMSRPFLRDVIFYMAAGFWAFCIFYRYTT